MSLVLIKVMFDFLKSLYNLPSVLILKGKKLEQEKAGKKWDSIVEELKNRK